MDPTIIEQDEIKLIGSIFYGNPTHTAKGWDTENEIGKLWTRFMQLMQKTKDKLGEKIIKPNMNYEVHIDPIFVKEENKWYVFVCKEVKDFSDIPLEMFYKILPKTKYAIFTGKGKDIPKTNNTIYQDWLPKSQYQEAYSYQIQAYDSERFFGLSDSKSELDFYIPIKKK
jgi:AraC family transcriptional regulator